MIINSQIVDVIRTYEGLALGLEEKVSNVKVAGISSGESNIVFFVDVNDAPYLIKVNGVCGKDESFFRGEYDKLKSLERYEIAPKAFVYDQNSLDFPFMILERYSGRNLRLEESEEKSKRLLSLLNNLVEVPVSEIMGSKGFKRDVKSCKEYVQLFPVHASNQLDEYQKRIGEDETYKLAKRAYESSRTFIDEALGLFEGSELGLVHTGIHPGNIILLSNGGLRLIDWEHSGVGDRAFEISSLFRSNFLGSQKKAEILNGYNGKTGLFEQRVEVYTELFKIHEVLWHAIRTNKAEKGEIQLTNEKDGRYYKNLLSMHIENLRMSELSSM